MRICEEYVQKLPNLNSLAHNTVPFKKEDVTVTILDIIHLPVSFI